MAPNTAHDRACARTAWPGAKLGRFDQGPVRLLRDVRQRLPEADRGRHHPREVFKATVLQQLLNSGAIADETVTPHTLRALLDAGRVRSARWRRRPRFPAKIWRAARRRHA
jgi:hypothetical protein